MMHNVIFKSHVNLLIFLFEILINNKKIKILFIEKRKKNVWNNKVLFYSDRIICNSEDVNLSNFFSHMCSSHYI